MEAGAEISGNAHIGITGKGEYIVGEDDDTHVAEVLELHDLESDPGKEAFKARAADNLTTRTIHHHVFSMSLIREMLEYCGFAVEYQQQLPPFNLITIAKKR